MKLVTAMLGHVDALTGVVDSETFTVTNAGGVAVGRGKGLVGFVGVKSPCAATRLELRARIGAGRLERSIFQLAGVRRGAYIDIQRTVRGDGKRVHGMIAAEGQSGDYGCGWSLGNDRSGGERIADDAFVDLSVDGALVKSDARSPRSTGGHGFAEAFGGICFAGTRFVLEATRNPPAGGLSPAG